MPAAFTRTSIFLSAYYKSDAFTLRGVRGLQETHRYRVLHFVPFADHEVSMATLLYDPLLRWHRLHFGQRGAKFGFVPAEERHAGSGAGHIDRDGRAESAGTACYEAVSSMEGDCRLEF